MAFSRGCDGGFDWHVKFRAPVRAGDSLQIQATVLNKRSSNKPGRGLATVRWELTNQHAEVVLEVETVILLATRPGGRPRRWGSTVDREHG
jgi:acyl dehydratase